MTIAEELRQEGWQRGRKEGRQQGRQEAHIEVLERQLTLKFGALPPEYATRVETATAEQLERCIERVLTAESLEAVFSSD